MSAPLDNQPVFPFELSQLKEIHSIYGSPLYIYNASFIKDRIQQLLSLFNDLPVNWLYAMKANDNPHILKLFSDAGFGFDTVSFEEVLLGQHFVEPKHIFYTENNMSDHEMHSAMQKGVLLNIGSFNRLRKFAEAGGRSCSIRLVPNIGDGLHARVTTGHTESKFGISTEYLDQIAELKNKFGLRVEGIHMHIGSGIRKAENMMNAMKRLLELSVHFPDLKFINFGGGFPIAYNFGEHNFDIQEFGRQATKLLKADLQNRGNNFSYYFEPGRWLVAQAGCLLTQITASKKAGNIDYLGCDTGFNHLARPVLYDASHRVIAVTKSGNEERNYTLAGNICESSDILASNIHLPSMQEGDLVALADAGAYGMTMASEYNRRPVPAEILINEDGGYTLIRNRIKTEDHISQFLNDCNFSS